MQDSASPNHSKGVLLTVISGVAVSVMAVADIILNNPGEVAAGESARALIAVLVLAVLFPVAAFKLGGPFRAVGYSFPIVLFLFFRFPSFLTAAQFFGLKSDAAIAGGAVGLLAIAAAASEPFRKRNPVNIAAFICVVTASAGLAMLVAVLVNHTNENARARSVVAEISAPLQGAEPSRAKVEPDILYVMPDRYADAAVFQEAFGTDNAEFKEALRVRGFYVAPNARSNFAKTFQSLPSTVNFNQLEALFSTMGPDAVDRRPFFDLIRDNAVQQTLHNKGYTFIYLGNWWGPSHSNPNADINYYGRETLWSRLSEFERALLRTTPIAYWQTYGGFIDREECARLKAQLEFLKTVRKKHTGPLFVFAHLTIPHAPITMDASGKCIRHKIHKAKGDWEDYRRAYRDYASYFNSALLEIFDANKNAVRNRDLLFVIQADEGPYPKRLHEDNLMNLFEMRDDEIRTKFGIINALYWDSDKYGSPYLTQTPVNNWRIIFSEVFGHDLPLVTDERSMLFRDESHIYELRDVTALLTGRQERLATFDASDRLESSD